MEITLKPQTLERISEKIRSGEFESADAVVEQALAFYLDFEEDQMDPTELEEVKSAIAESRQQVERGETISLAEFDKRIRAKYAIPR